MERCRRWRKLSSCATSPLVRVVIRSPCVARFGFASSSVCIDERVLTCVTVGPGRTAGPMSERTVKSRGIVKAYFKGDRRKSVIGSR